MDALRLHVVHEPVAAVRGRVRGLVRLARAAQVEQDQHPLSAQSAQVTEVGGGAGGTAGHADQGRSDADDVVREFGVVV